MKKIILLLVSVCMIAPLMAQTNFQDLTLKDALEKAKKEGKKVYVDCYTSWCGPCKIMAEKILPLKEVGDFLNERFVCVKYDMEKGEGPEIAKKYGVEAYPTFLLLDADGRLIQSIVGMTSGGEELIYQVRLAIGDISTVKMDSEYAAGNRLSRFILTYLKALQATKQWDKAKKVSDELLKSLSDGEKAYVTYWFIYEDNNISPWGSENVDYLLSHVDNFRKGVGVKPVDAKLTSLFETQLEDIIRGRNKAANLADVEALEKNLKTINLPESECLFGYVALAKGIKQKNTEATLKVYMKLFPELSDEKLSYLYFQPLMALKGLWSKAQKKELASLSLKLADKVNNKTLKDGLKNFAESMIPQL